MARPYERTRDCLSAADIHLSTLDAAAVLSRAKSKLTLPYFESLADRRQRYRSLNFNTYGAVSWYYRTLAQPNLKFYTCSYCRDALPQSLADFGTHDTLCKYCKAWHRLAATGHPTRVRGSVRVCPVRKLPTTFLLT